VNGTETAAAWAAGVIAFGALLAAWKNIRDGLAALWHVFGWRGSFWRFLRRAVETVDVILSLPAQLATLQSQVETVTGELAIVKQQVAENTAETAAGRRETRLLKRQVIAVERSNREHLKVAAPKTELLDYIAGQLGVAVPLIQETHHEVRNNSGSSLKDSAHRLERALGLPEPTERTADPDHD
jgi:hypothetical protein